VRGNALNINDYDSFLMSAPGAMASRIPVMRW
jgi:hypothetical protein